jgi:phosphatidylserine/phosphatidylglycerophosphate/cardiolipin synthase-like enzyme
MDEPSTQPATRPPAPRRAPKRDALYLITIALLIALCGQFYYSYYYKPQAARDITVFYNQERQANVEITRAIQDAQEFVYFAVYTFTREDIRDALLAAKYRGLEVKGIMDRKQSEALESQRAIVRELQNAGITIIFNDHSYIMHLKTLVTEQAFVSGSYNWTASATNLNDEIIEIGRDEDVRKQYQETLETIFARYEGRS